MAYVVVCIATRWGSALGGINVFNTGLATGFAEILPKPSTCICILEEMPAYQAEAPVRLITASTWNAEAVSEAIFKAIDPQSTPAVEAVLVIGHDVHTGQIAVDCAKLLQRRIPLTPVKSAVVSHMDYREYGRRKGQALDEVDSKASSQVAIVASADFSFSVGPLLSDSFQSAREAHGDRVVALTPGASDIEPQPEKASSLTFFMGGRLGLEDDQIKNGVLGVRAVLEAYRAERKLGSLSRWRTRGHFYACGVDRKKDDELLRSLDDEARRETAFEIEAIEFSNRQQDVHRHLVKCDVALMPSWHEGFGLSGWEAISAGVPLVCSSQSGLALLISELRRQLPEDALHSIEFVHLSGGSPAGIPNGQDIEALSQAVRKVVDDYSARKVAALTLARHVKRLFTWKQCASTLVGPLQWPLATSQDWWQRKRAADAEAGRYQDVANADMVLQALEASRAGMVERRWELACSALNLISDRGAEVKLGERQTLKEDLLVIGEAIGSALDAKRALGSVPIVDTVFLDLCWRYLAAASKAARSFSEFTELLPSGMRTAIFSDGFLRRELLFYVSRFASEFDGTSDERAKSFLDPLSRRLTDDRALAVRLARLSAVHPSLRRVMPTNCAAFEAEMARCSRALGRPFDLSRLIEESPKLASTVLALSSLKPDPVRQSVDQPIAFVKRLGPSYVATGSWRGDKRLAAAMMSVTLSSGNVFAMLESMATDEEEAVRWAALDLAFSPVLRARLEAMEDDAGKGKTLRLRLGRIVDDAVTTGDGHPWLAREFLSHYLDEYAQPKVGSADVARFTLVDFPKSRELLGPAFGSGGVALARPMHPDVMAVRARAAQRFKRVLLVLPPISVDPANRQGASKTSTPPLGLGLLASHLAQQGHDVHLADCHRFPELADDVKRLASTFDLIGFTTVFSTIRATQHLLKEIRGATLRPLLVVGGPAANLGAWRYSARNEDDLRNWDFVVSEDSVGNLQRLVDALRTTDSWPNGRGILANEHSAKLSERDANAPGQEYGVGQKLADDQAWMTVKLDRRLYNGPHGQYEPGTTRDLRGRVHEAHVVMSKGCDWNCSFCTERRELSGGERRRDVESVLQEVRELATRHANLRIQFIDDNLFPQIASSVNANDIAREAGKAWAMKFLEGLKQIRTRLGGRLTWRGIFRLEDFAAYESLGPEGGFVQVLTEAGCNMLAFGVESGVEASRHSIKAGGREFSNAAIVSLFRRLRRAGIFSKAYFIIGGKKETAASTEETISFAVNCGATLAYFALYKDFVPAHRQLRQDWGVGASKTASLLDYRQMLPNWDAAFLKAAARKAQSQAISSFGLQTPASVVERQTYQKLSRMGFTFSDLVKYNDYHAESGPAGAVLQDVTWNRPDEFFALVEKAYRRFYLRPEFVSDFKELVAAGY